LISACGRPVLFHCAAGKDRTGYASALLLRLLGILPQTVMEDYLLSNRYYYPSFRGYLFALRLFKGKQFAAGVQRFLEVQPAYLSAGYEASTCRFGSFEGYVRDGLGLSTRETELLKNFYLE
jgi:protein-tyrosine phosphatase